MRVGAELYVVVEHIVILIELGLLECGVSYTCIGKSNGLGLLNIDHVGGGRGLVSIVGQHIGLPAEYLAGKGVDLILVLVVSGVELQLVVVDIVILVQLGLLKCGLGHTCIGKSNGLGFINAYHALGIGRDIIVINGADLLAEYLAGESLDVILILIGHGEEIKLVVVHTVVLVQLGGLEGDIGNACILKGDGLCILKAYHAVGVNGAAVAAVYGAVYYQTGLGVDFVPVFGLAAVKAHIVDEAALAEAELTLGHGCGVGVDARVGNGAGEGCIAADGVCLNGGGDGEGAADAEHCEQCSGTQAGQNGLYGGGKQFLHSLKFLSL